MPALNRMAIRPTALPNWRFSRFSLSNSRPWAIGTPLCRITASCWKKIARSRLVILSLWGGTFFSKRISSSPFLGFSRLVTLGPASWAGAVRACTRAASSLGVSLLRLRYSAMASAFCRRDASHGNRLRIAGCRQGRAPGNQALIHQADQALFQGVHALVGAGLQLRIDLANFFLAN